MQGIETIDWMDAPKSKRQQITATINVKLLARLDAWADENGWNRSEALDRLIERNLPEILHEQNAGKKNAPRQLR